MKNHFTIGVLAIGLASQAAASTPMSNWTVADVNKKIDTCVATFSDLAAKAENGDKAAEAALPAELEKTTKCLTQEQVFHWMFYYGWEKTEIFSSKLMAGLERSLGVFDWIETVKEANALEAYCDKDTFQLHKAHCYISLLNWWASFGPAKTSKADAEKKIQLYFSNIEKAGNEVNTQTFALPSGTDAEKNYKLSRLAEAADWWFEDAANYMDLRDAEEKIKNTDPPLIIEGFRRSILALREIMKIDPKDVSTASDLVWMQANVDASELELATFRGKKGSFSGSAVDIAEQYEKSNTENFYYYSFMMDVFFVGVTNWQIEDVKVRQRVLDYFKHTLVQAEKTAQQAYDDLEAFIKANPSAEAAYLEEFVKHANSVINTKVRSGYFTSTALVGGMKDAREARKKNGAMAKPIRLGAGVTPDQEKVSRAAGATHIVKSVAEVKNYLNMNAQDLSR